MNALRLCLGCLVFLLSFTGTSRGTAQGMTRAPLTERTHASPPASGSVRIFVQPGAGVTPILDLIRQAQRSVRLEIYLLTDRPIIEELGRARHNGVDVRVLLEERPYGSSRSAVLAYHALQQVGVPVRWANEGAFTFTHEKAMEIDDRIAGIFSLNLTASGIDRNREFGIIDQDSTDARAVAAIFAGDWNRRRIEVSDPRLVVSPTTSRHDLEGLIGGAHRTLDIYAEEVADRSVENRLATAVRRGVRVRVITSTRSPGTDTLERSRVSVRIMSRPYVHAKAVVADGENLFVGSENFSTTSLDHNREVGIILRDRRLAGVVEQTFGGDWSSGSGNGGSPPATGSAVHGSGNLRVRVSVAPSRVHRGELTTIEARTSPGATCSLRVTYPDGYISRSRSLAIDRTSSSAGVVTWSWRLGSSVSGQSQAQVTCRLDGSSATGTATFTIVPSAL